MFMSLNDKIRVARHPLFKDAKAVFSELVDALRGGERNEARRLFEELKMLGVSVNIVEPDPSLLAPKASA